MKKAFFILMLGFCLGGNVQADEPASFSFKSIENAMEATIHALQGTIHRQNDVFWNNMVAKSFLQRADRGIVVGRQSKQTIEILKYNFYQTLDLLYVYHLMASQPNYAPAMRDQVLVMIAKRFQIIQNNIAQDDNYENAETVNASLDIVKIFIQTISGSSDSLRIPKEVLRETIVKQLRSVADQLVQTSHKDKNVSKEKIRHTKNIIFDFDKTLSPPNFVQRSKNYISEKINSIWPAPSLEPMMCSILFQ